MITVYYREHSDHGPIKSTGIAAPDLAGAWAAWRPIAHGVTWHTAWVRPI